MLIDNKGKLFGKISIIDIAIIAVILIAFIGIGYKLYDMKSSNTNIEEELYLIEFESLESPDYAVKELEERFKEREKDLIVNDPVKKIEFGKVVDVETGPSRAFTNDSEGQLHIENKPGYMAINVTAEGMASPGGNGVKYGNFEYFIGKTIEIRAGNVALWVRIIDIKEKE